MLPVNISLKLEGVPLTLSTNTVFKLEKMVLVGITFLESDNSIVGDHVWPSFIIQSTLPISLDNINQSEHNFLVLSKVVNQIFP